jgi:hypothetical protein
VTLEQIRKTDEERPFQRFTLVLADGARVPVRSPETLSHPGGGRSIIVWERPSSGG